MSTYTTYALVRQNKKGQKELEILRPIFGNEFAIESGTIKRNLNEAKFGLDRFAVGDMVAAYFFLGGKYEKLHSILSTKRFETMGNVFIGVKSEQRFSSDLLKRIDAVHMGSAAVIGLAAEASKISGVIQFAPLPIEEGTAKKIAEILPCHFELRPVGSNVPDAKVEIAPVAPTPAVEKPEAGGYYYVAPEVNLFLSAATQTLKKFGGKNSSVAMALLGASGYGKTTLAERLAQKLGFECVRLNCALISEPEEIAVQRALKDGNTIVQLKRFAKVLMAGNAVVIFDELNRAYPNILNSLFALLDGGGEEEFVGERVTVGDNVIFMATMNVGSEYTGTFRADRALLNRFSGYVVVGAMPVSEELRVLRSAHGISVEDAKLIVTMASELRRSHNDVVEVSTRTTLAVAMFVKAGLSVRQAFETVVVQQCDADDKKTIIDAINSKLGVMSVSSGVKLLL